MSFGDFLLPFILLLGGLIFVHELGHFLLAKAFGVKVERFSLGFGPAIVSRTVGETKYVVAWLPLGGYVKMLGEMPGEELPAADRPRSFNAQSVWKRMAIAAAGPGMNFVLPVFVLAGVYMAGVPTQTSRVGDLVLASPAAEAGVQPGDRITAVGDVAVDTWDGVMVAVQGRAEGALVLTLDRDGERLEVTLPPASPGQPLRGLRHETRAALLAVPDGASPAARAGVRTGDRIEALNGEPVRDWYGFLRRLRQARDTLALEVSRRIEGETERLALRVDPPASAEGWSPERLGVALLEATLLLSVEPESPAAQAGLEAGDLVLAVGGERIPSFDVLKQQVQASQGRPLAFRVQRAGRELELAVTPEWGTLRQPIGSIEAWKIGVSGDDSVLVGELRDQPILNPLHAGWLGVAQTVRIFRLTFEGLGKLVTGQVGRDSLAGPIGIGKIAADSFKLGWFEFFWVMAVVSVNLGILNLLPIPILDGGHIVFGLAEAVRGSPFPFRAREIAQQIGLSLLVLLMGFAFWNDLTRYWSQIMGFLQELV